MSDIRSTSTVRSHTNFRVCIASQNSPQPFSHAQFWVAYIQTFCASLILPESDCIYLLLGGRNNYLLFQINNMFENVCVILVFAINCLEFLILGLSQVNWRIEYVNVNLTLLLIFPVLWFSTDYVFHLWQSPVTRGNLVNKSPGEFYLIIDMSETTFRFSWILWQWIFLTPHTS